jgi:two-component system invasion response regulator UvrY
MTSFLVVDDHELVRRGLRQLLHEQAQATEVVEATSVAGMLELLADRRFDAVLLDVAMPERGGLDGLAEVHRRWPTLRVIMVSAHGDSELVAHALAAGAAAFVTKSEAATQIAEAVRTVLAGGRYAPGATLPPVAKHGPLSLRELQVLRMIASGLAPRDIARELGISTKTVATFRHRIGQKTGLRSSAEMARYAVRQGIVQDRIL